jgi:hypothetical protein
MKTTIYKTKLTGLLIVVFLMMAGYSQSQTNCVPDSLNATNVTEHTVHLSWAGITGPTHVRYFPTGTTDYEVRETHMNHMHLHNLLSNTPYSWELSNFCNGEWTEYAGNGSFTTLADTVPPPACIPTNLAATDVTAHEVDLTWEGIQGPTWVRYFPAGDTTEYEYKFTHENEVSIHHLLPATTYSWDLNNFCDGQWTGYSGNGSFTTLTDTIPAPTCIPTNLTDTNVTANSAELSWEGISGPTHIRYYTADTAIYECRETHMNHITLDSLMPNTQYFWDLSNFCDGEWTPYTGDGTFTTLSGTYITGIINATVQKSGLSVYPNPMKEVATVIYSSTDNGSYLFKITDITGRVILSGTKQVSAGTNSFEVNLAGNPKGIYFLNLQKGSEFKHVRFIKE